MPSTRAQQLLQRLDESNNEAREVTVKLTADTVAIANKYKEKSLREAIEELVRIAGEVLTSTKQDGAE